MSTDFNEQARRLRNAVEPVAAGVYFAPEALAAYKVLGFDGTPGADADGVARPELKGGFGSRSACMGDGPGETVASAFVCFNPAVVVPAVAAGRKIASRDAVLDAREREQPSCCAESSATTRRVSTESRICFAAPRTPRLGLATRCTAACAHSASRASPWVTCGAPRISSESTAATATSFRGRSEVPTRWRCSC